MNKLKWFSGGKERRDQAIIIITDVLNELTNDPKSESLQKVLGDYKDELERDGAAVPLILSRMNIAISNAIRKDGMDLPKHQADKLKELTALSNIR
ncbi:bacteriocin immunity protein [Enterococcus sp. AZ109]|uniref:bacteriocin immunity protein n=1 Tax=Enterococcus sp. AZ109 TaxID=2774634 RepID=UPI003F293D51